MSPTLICLAVSFVGTGVGYRPAPQGGVELIVQISPNMLQTLSANDHIQVAVPPEVQQIMARSIALELGNLPPERTLPAGGAASGAQPFRSPPPGSAASLGAPNVLPAGAAEPLPPQQGPALSASPDGVVHTPPPSGDPAAPATTGPQGQYAGAGSAANGNTPGRGPIETLSPVGNNGAMRNFDGWQFGMLMLIIGLAATNAYVGVMYVDARRRYLGMVAQSFAKLSST